ncbi:hypothetical protein UFOVP1325_35 [uncultured Caudovirales phage]|uniref:Uncharacterized protein n=1 Tax=uncultured Caudovirales phage TaxID=2100421 RepID=A0A6J5RX73_9CAUD|nr:hypothetical protein UFOVP1325_35 [uncultured Caudovirales phage]CAB4212822.1 hypothetical protein UFOVP1435_36 [uncultured Caudovirales phage]CAB5227975.1 hypothetical protein UFOVP1530_26 [uncultured Caudovirales phage]
MSYLITAAVFTIAGFALGVLFYRNNKAKVEATEAKAKTIADQFKS